MAQNTPNAAAVVGESPLSDGQGDVDISPTAVPNVSSTKDIAAASMPPAKAARQST
jgi:hypothetical protein